MSLLKTRASMYCASKLEWSRGVISHLTFAEISFVSSVWSKSRASSWKYRPSRLVAHVKPGPQSLTKGTPGTAEPVLMASCTLGELLPAQLPCGCVSGADCHIPFDRKPTGPVRVPGPKIVEPRGSKPGVPK